MAYTCAAVYRDFTAIRQTSCHGFFQKRDAKRPRFPRSGWIVAIGILVEESVVRIRELDVDKILSRRTQRIHNFTALLRRNSGVDSAPEEEVRPVQVGSTIEQSGRYSSTVV